jgi:NarL family two-component system response regulator LiaR
MNQIRVLLVEHDPVWQMQVKTCLCNEPDLMLLGAVGTKEEALQIVRTLQVDVVVMAVLLSEDEPVGIEAALEIGRQDKTKIIMLSVVQQERIIVEAFGHHACNYVHKSHLADIPEAIRAAYHDQSPIHHTSAKAIRNEVMRMQLVRWREQLTPSELHILRLLDQGMSHKQMSEYLSITQSTVKKHVNRIIHKYRVRSGREAARKARMRGIL